MDKLQTRTQDFFITKHDSVCLYGVAILLMVFHHCFCIPSRLGENYISVLGDYAFEARIAWMGKLCVAIFAFVSGYAFSVKSKEYQKTGILDRLLCNYRLSVVQLFRFYSKYWLVFIVFVPIGIAFFGKSSNPKDLVRGLILGRGYCGEWWYISQYIKYLILFPLLNVYLSELISLQNPRRAIIISVIFSIAALAGVIVIRVALWDTLVGDVIRFVFNHLYSHYMIIFISAFLIGRFSIYEKIACRWVISAPLCFLCLMGMIIIRWLLVTAPDQSNFDPFLTPVLVFSLVGLFHKMKKKGFIILVLRLFGKYSTFMWLTHAFWIYYYFQPVVLVVRYSALIFIWAVILSLATAVLFDRFYHIIYHHITFAAS